MPDRRSCCCWGEAFFSDVHNVRPPFSDIFVRFYVCSSINKLFHAVHIPVCSRADLPWKSMGWASYERKIYIIKASAKCKGEEEMEDRSAGKVLETSCWKQQAPILKPFISPLRSALRVRFLIFYKWWHFYMGIYCHEEHVRSSDVNGFAQPHESHSALHKGNEALLKVNLKSGVGWHQ